jgi:hypothetical protein
MHVVGHAVPVGAKRVGEPVPGQRLAVAGQQYALRIADR